MLKHVITGIVDTIILEKPLKLDSYLVRILTTNIDRTM